MTTYDVFYRDNGVHIAPHFCREMGCFGSNPDHGYTLEQAAEQCAEYYEQQAKAFREGTHPDLMFYKEQEEEA